MGKRSTGRFRRRLQDAYATPFEAALPLLPHLVAEGITRFVEPCSGDGDLVEHLESLGLTCVCDSDIRFGNDALAMGQAWFDRQQADAIITNPPWTRTLLHPLIWHLSRLATTWLLFDSDWAHCKQAVPYLPYCSTIVAIGRVKWFEGSPYTGKDNCCWYRFQRELAGGPLFIGREDVLLDAAEAIVREAAA